MQAVKKLSPQGRYQDAVGVRYSVDVAAHIVVPVGSPLQVTETESMIAFLAAEGLRAVAVLSGPVPTLTARQLRLWIINDGMALASVDAQINAIADPTAQAKARVEWEYATTYHHDHPLVLQIGAALGLTPAQIDAAFCVAATL